MAENVTVKIEQHVASVRFSNPPTNFANVGLLRSLADTLKMLDDDANVRCIVLSSEGSVFCAGADLVSPNGFGAESADPLREFYDQVERLFENKKPVIAAIQGAAIGAGLGLAVFADFRVASPAARFAANFVKLGFHPGFALTYTLPRLLGEQKALELFLTANRYKAEEAFRIGLVDILVSNAESLESETLLFAKQIAENAPLGLLATRATLKQQHHANVKKAIAHEHQEQLKLQTTEDFAEGVKSVTERRPGNFKGC